MSSEKLEGAIKSIEAGDQTAAMRVLAGIVTTDPKNEMAWFWLSKCVEENDRKRYCLSRVLAINPNNVLASQALAQLESLSQPSFEEPTERTSELSQPPRPTNILVQGGRTTMEQLFDVAILDYAKLGWRLIYRDKAFAQMILPKRTDLPLFFMLIPLAAFGLAVFTSITTRDFSGATGILYIGSSIGFWLTGVAVARWFGMRDESVFLYIDQGEVKTIRK